MAYGLKEVTQLDPERDDEEQLVGYVGVDSGQIVIGDPCVFKGWSDHQGAYDFENPTCSYERVSKITLEQEAGESEEDNVVACRTGGDGTYAVYVTFRHGRPQSLTIVFEDDNEPQDEGRPDDFE